MKPRLLLFLLLAPFTAHAVELFGVSLSQSTQDQLRNAVKQAGAELVKEAGRDGFFDVYDSGKILPGSSRLYLGYVKKTGKFAFAEYEFNGLLKPGLVGQLEARYGKPELVKGRFFSDVTYRWKANDINIMLYADWLKYKTRLDYSDETALQQLRAEMHQGQVTQRQDQKGILSKAY